MQRITALKETAFQRKRFDGFLVFNWANILYFTGFPGASALLVPRDGEATIYVYGVNYEQAKAEGKNIHVELVKRNENLMAKISGKVVDCNVKRLAVDALGMESWRSLKKENRGKMKIEIKPAFVSELRAVKDETEIALMRKAANLTNEGMKTAYETLSPGKKEYEVAAEIEYTMRKRGSYGTAFETAVSSGSRSAFPRRLHRPRNSQGRLGSRRFRCRVRVLSLRHDADFGSRKPFGEAEANLQHREESPAGSIRNPKTKHQSEGS